MRRNLLTAWLVCGCADPSKPASIDEAPPVVPEACLSLDDLVAGSGIRYVMPGAAADGDGSAARPFASIEQALAASAPDTDIRVASGTYVETVLFDDPRAHAGLALRACEVGGVVIASSLTIRGATGAALRGVRITGMMVEGEFYVSGAYAIEIADVVVTTSGNAVTFISASVAMSGSLRFITPNPAADAFSITGSDVTLDGSLEVSGGGIGVVVQSLSTFRSLDGATVVVHDTASRGVYLDGSVWTTEGTGRLEVARSGADAVIVRDGAWMQLGDAEIEDPTLSGLYLRDGTLDLTGVVRVSGALGSAGAYVGYSSSTLPARLAVSGSLITEGGASSGVRIYPTGVVTIEDAATLSVTGSASTGVYVSRGTLTMDPGGTLRVASTGGNGIYSNGGAMALENVTVDGVTGSSPYGDGILLRDLSAPATLTNVSVRNAARAGVLIVGSMGAWTGGEVENNQWAVVHQSCTAGEEMAITGVDPTDNADDAIYGCDGGVTFDLP